MRERDNRDMIVLGTKYVILDCRTLSTTFRISMYVCCGIVADKLPVLQVHHSVPQLRARQG